MPGKTVREVIENLDQQFPGFKERLEEADSLRPGLTVIVDGEPAVLRLRQPLREDSQVHFLPAISGGEV
jgi:molybdopterin converting factor small subunit